MDKWLEKNVLWKEGWKKKLMADIIFIKGKREDGRSPNSIMKYLLIFYCLQNIMKAISWEFR